MFKSLLDAKTLKEYLFILVIRCAVLGLIVIFGATVILIIYLTFNV